MVTLRQLYLDGIASSEGIVRQFVAMPIGSGYSVEVQISGEETVGRLQLCINSAIRSRANAEFELIFLVVKMLTRKAIPIDVPKSGDIDNIKFWNQAKGGVPPDYQRFDLC